MEKSPVSGCVFLMIFEEVPKIEFSMFWDGEIFELNSEPPIFRQKNSENLKYSYGIFDV